MPPDIKQLIKQGADRHRLGDIVAAKENYLKALELESENANALHLLGQILHTEGDNEGAIELILRALEINPRLTNAHYNLAVIYKRAGKLKQAEAAFSAHISRRPDDGDALLAFALMLHRQNRRVQAAALYEHLTTREPDNLEARVNFGVCLTEIGRPLDAITQLEAALALNPGDTDALNNLAMAQQSAGRAEDAYDNLIKSGAAETDNPAISANLVRAGLRLGHYNQSLERAGAALSAQPEDAALNIIDAIALPFIAPSRETISAARARMEEKVAALAGKELALSDPLAQIGMTNFQSVYLGLNERPLQEQLAGIYANSVPGLSFTAPHCGKKPVRGKKIKIGFASAHLGSHTIGKLNRALICGLNPDRFDVHVFSLGAPPAGIQPLYAGIGGVHLALPDIEGARSEIAEAELDILYYPDIGMEPLSYFLGFARLAPVQCVSWGHPVTTGLSEIDFFLSNAPSEPQNAGANYTEQLIQSARFDVCVPKPDLPPDIKPQDQLDLGGAKRLYVCPQSLFKIHPDMDPAFAAILAGDPDAEILLIEGAQENWTSLLKARFQNTIADAARIKFIPRLSGVDYIHLIAAADVILDTFPFSGGLSSFEALALNKPIVTWPGAHLCGRLTLGLYRQMEILETIADSAESYVQIALQLGMEVDFREDHRRKLDDRTGEIFGDRGIITEREAFFEECFEAACA
ncbi:MAG: tetratricopeptide repeat protein [Rhodospirillales bacterium]|nr:tetratricopeptide repeat protein [Rhodospirillales bacterium]